VVVNESGDVVAASGCPRGALFVTRQLTLPDGRSVIKKRLPAAERVR
jgi:tetrathionate reductase subunit A